MGGDESFDLGGGGNEKEGRDVFGKWQGDEL